MVDDLAAVVVEGVGDQPSVRAGDLDLPGAQQTVAGYAALRTGVVFLPLAAATLAASTSVGRAMTRVRPGTLLAAGLLLAAAGLAHLARLDVDGGYALGVLPALLLIGAGVGALSPVAAGLATLGVPGHRTGIASAPPSTSPSSSARPSESPC